MKTIKKISYLIGAFMLLYNNSFSQTTYNTSPVTFPSPNHDVLYGQTGIMAIMGGAYPTSSPLTYCGINTETPQYILDIVGTYAGDGVNVSNPATLPNPNAVGYSIGSQMVLWNNGITDDIFAGVGAGNAGVTGQYNTYVGNDAGFSTVSGNSNSFIGAWSTEQV